VSLPPADLPRDESAVLSVPGWWEWRLLLGGAYLVGSDGSVASVGPSPPSPTMSGRNLGGHDGG
jgi:hypothetical protein